MEESNLENLYLCISCMLHNEESCGILKADNVMVELRFMEVQYIGLNPVSCLGFNSRTRVDHVWPFICYWTIIAINLRQPNQHWRMVKIVLQWY